MQNFYRHSKLTSIVYYMGFLFIAKFLMPVITCNSQTKTNVQYVYIMIRDYACTHSCIVHVYVNACTEGKELIMLTYIVPVFVILLLDLVYMYMIVQVQLFVKLPWLQLTPDDGVPRVVRVVFVVLLRVAANRNWNLMRLFRHFHPLYFRRSIHSKMFRTRKLIQMFVIYGNQYVGNLRR